MVDGWEYCKDSLDWFCENLENDSGLSPEQKDDFVEHLKKSSCDESVLEALRDYCRGQKLIGQESSVGSEESLGRVSPRSNLIKQIMEESSLGSFYDAENLLNTLLVETDLDSTLGLLTPIEDVNIGKFLIWSFRPKEPTANPFKQVDDLGSLPSILGLDPVLEECVTFSHRLPSTHLPARNPTIFDAEDNRHWIPGGKTKPLCKGYDEGLPEVVHKPNTFANIASPLIEISDERA